METQVRTHVDDDQIVQVDGYAYRWDGDEPLAVGDEVMLPENWISVLRVGHGPFKGTVTALGSSYDGPLSFVLRRT